MTWPFVTYLLRRDGVEHDSFNEVSLQGVFSLQRSGIVVGENEAVTRPGVGNKDRLAGTAGLELVVEVSRRGQCASTDVKLVDALVVQVVQFDAQMASGRNLDNGVLALSIGGELAGNRAVEIQSAGRCLRQADIIDILAGSDGAVVISRMKETDLDYLPLVSSQFYGGLLPTRRTAVGGYRK